MKLVTAPRPLYIRRMQTALHIAALTAQLKQEIVGGKIISTEFYKKLRAAYLIIKKDRSKLALGFVYHPAGSGCFCVPASKLKIETREKPWPIFGLDGAIVCDVSQPGLDRIFEITVDLSGKKKRLIMEVMGPNGNLWLTDELGGKEATLRKRQFQPGEAYQAFPMADRLDPRSVTAEQLLDGLKADPDRSPLAALKGLLIGFNETMIWEAVSRAGLELSDLRQPDSADLPQLARSIGDISARFATSEAGYLYLIRGGAEVYPFKLTSRDQQPEKFKSLSLATIEMVNRKQTTGDETDEEKKVLKAVNRGVKRHTRLKLNLTQDVERAAGYERYKLWGDLLQLNRDKLKRGMKQVEVEDVLSGTERMVEIELDPAATPNDNIEAYFRRHRKGREGIDLLERRLVIVASELEALLAMQAALESNFETASRRYQAELLSLMPQVAERQELEPRLPYRPARLSSGVTIFIGRDGSDNDRTTFDFARPYELWFHTQQCPGSHVVMKYPNKSFEPSKREIEETAAIAAFHSKARNDSLVPVIYTQRRYVRKPRKAKPGLVMVERESSVMVAPRKEQKEQKE